jgi:membrane protease YdiL (CAAX protease family)
MDGGLRGKPGVKRGDAATKDPLRARRRAITVLVASALIFSFSYYHKITYGSLVYGLVYLALPLAVILLLRENPLHFGLGLGDWRRSLIYTLVCIIALVVPIYLGAQVPEMRAYYGPRAKNIGLAWAIWQGAAMFAWEFFFRGFLLFGLEEALVWVQAVIFTMAHFGKPEVETYTSLVGGVILGYVVLRTRSFYPAWLSHWFLILGLNGLIAVG